MTQDAPDPADPFGLLTPSFAADPYPAYARLRVEAPVHFSESANAWLYTRHDDVSAAFRDARLSANRATGFAQKIPPAAREALAPLLGSLAGWILLMDPPAHTRLRALVNKAFVPRLVERMRPSVEAIVAGLLDAMEARGDSADLVRDLAAALPVFVIADILGLPREDQALLRRGADAIGAFLGARRMSMEIAAAASASVHELEEYFRVHLDDHRAHPRDDLLGSLLAADEKGSFLDERELLATCIMVLFGGHETTTNLIGNGVLALVANPAELDALRRSPELFPGAVEELLRYDSPVQRMGRVAVEPIDLAGARIEKGDRVYLMIGAANRDPRAFPDPDRLDVRRSEVKHLSFGLGAHFCVGASLARLEAEVVWSALFRRFPALAVVPTPLHWIDNFTVRGVESLPVKLSP
jgi:cytochrome P450